MKLTLLGTGTSQGVPVIGCSCDVCSSDDFRDCRLRSSAMISTGGVNIVIDAGPDFRQQMLREKVKNISAILLTHEHTDHMIGLDDVRPFNFSMGKSLNVYCQPRVAGEIKKRFEYVFGEYIPGLPQIDLVHVEKGDVVNIEGVAIQCIGVEHGQLPILGFRVGELTYLTDVKSVTETEKQKIRGSKYLVVNALHHKHHHAHMSLDEAVAFALDIGAEKTWFTHVSHNMGRVVDVEPDLPLGILFGYDGMVVEFEG